MPRLYLLGGALHGGRLGHPARSGDSFTTSHCRAKRISVSLTPSMERVQTAFARPAPSSATDWKSSSSRSALQPVPWVQMEAWIADGRSRRDHVSHSPIGE